MKNFDLMFCCLGNGITVVNRAVNENGDYKQVCHISENGNIKFYVESCKIPGGDLLRIEHHADVQYHKFNNWLDSLPERKQYGYLLDRVTHEDFMRVIHMTNNIIDKIAYLKSKFYQTH